MADKENNQGQPLEDATVVESVSPASESDVQDSDSATDEPLDDMDDDDNLDEEEIISLKDKVINFLKEKAPFVYALYLKITKQGIPEDNEDIDEEEEVDDEDEEVAGDEIDKEGITEQGLAEKLDATIKDFKDKLLQSMPFLEKLISKINQGSNKKIKRPRKKILSQKMTYLIFFALIAWLLFDEGFNPKTEKTIKPKTPITQQVIDKQNQQTNIEIKTTVTEETTEVDPQQPPHEVTTSENSDVPVTIDVEPLPVEITTATTETVSEESETPIITDTEQSSAETLTATEETSDSSSGTSPEQGLAQEASPADTETPQLSKDILEQEPSNAKTEPSGKTEIEKTKDLDTEIRDIIEKVEEKYADKEDYESPPDYTKVGRGLVYNCKNKHWSCLNRTNYHQCRKNQIFYTKLKVLPECVVFDVYYSDEDCQIKQADMINKLIPVPACTQQVEK
ncbi:MAG: hypothetical protein A2381_04675 [Bdellovibrionales bacterium RIFOXYB1_FULL_37_110]|nr:MAG: hypothetical protein A2181_01105 [Bdellovibrionales bacterium RIFOXYA1_FULL_38_20]OFZ50480.1 MAG: hypothetical protein A2417_10655 [Bdellovibrionales bacterium RIFOXYC1_FULL_37_79]OFZ60751.1 MAG: hypothetical protein A2381_04675 [Bdellovibrionales bacterium RIFOXYB1_FULL_37_110]OFZ64465.1 MAG: hypothetical protein A2577_08640 [Bdellovibrionales bacterium RIFOXYD1_FULL_36_51]